MCDSEGGAVPIESNFVKRERVARNHAGPTSRSFVSGCQPLLEEKDRLRLDFVDFPDVCSGLPWGNLLACSSNGKVSEFSFPAVRPQYRYRANPQQDGSSQQGMLSGAGGNKRLWHA